MSKLQNKIPPPVIALVVGFAMWALHRHFPLFAFNLPFLFYLGWLCIAVGVSLDIISFLDFRKKRTTINPLSPEKATSLVVKGLYRLSRNPMYLGLLLVLIGTALLFSSLVAFLMLPIFILLMNYLQIKAEETALQKIFGEQYIGYKKKVRRWL